MEPRARRITAKHHLDVVHVEVAYANSIDCIAPETGGEVAPNIAPLHTSRCRQSIARGTRNLLIYFSLPWFDANSIDCIMGAGGEGDKSGTSPGVSDTWVRGNQLVWSSLLSAPATMAGSFLHLESSLRTSLTPSKSYFSARNISWTPQKCLRVARLGNHDDPQDFRPCHSFGLALAVNLKTQRVLIATKDKCLMGNQGS